MNKLVANDYTLLLRNAIAKTHTRSTCHLMNKSELRVAHLWPFEQLKKADMSLD